MIATAACTTPNPNYRRPQGDAGPDATGPDALVGPLCTVNEALRCDGPNLIRCDAEGAAELTESCALGCNDAEKRCFDVSPSNGLAQFLNQASGQPDLNLGDTATINTDTGDITVDESAIGPKSETLIQSGAPAIRVLIVRSLTAKDVVVTGKNALAVVSSGEIRINGVFTVSAKSDAGGPGAMTDDSCKGQDGMISRSQGDISPAEGGRGGGGFGTAGGSGGEGRNNINRASGGPGGTVTGNAWLEPLRGGCHSGSGSGAVGGGGGGAIQLVSRSQIVVSGEGVVAANGGGGKGGGSGGGILIEAPVVDVSGHVVANGGAGGGCDAPPDGRFDGTRATGTASCAQFIFLIGAGGNGATGSSGATDGASIFHSSAVIYGGSGGGGVGRIRVNTLPGGQRTSGLYSPVPTTGTLATR